MAGIKIGYVPRSADLSSALDRRRFPFYAKMRGIPFEIADYRSKYDLLIVNEKADITLWADYPWKGGRYIYEISNSYISARRGSIKTKLRGLARYLSGQHSKLRWNYWKCIERICKRADLVICATEEQARIVEAMGCKFEQLIDFHYEFSPVNESNNRSSRPFRIVWEGEPQNAKSVKLIEPALKRLREEMRFELVFVTASSYYAWAETFNKKKTFADVCNLNDYVEVVPWNTDTFSQVISSCDLGIIPLDMNDPFECGKPENKLVELWKVGLPVLTSSTPAYTRAMKAAGLEDMLCHEVSDWVEKIHKYAINLELLASSGQKGLDFANTEYSIDAMCLKWDRAIARALA